MNRYFRSSFLVLALAAGFSVIQTSRVPAQSSNVSFPPQKTIPWDQIGTKAGANYRGDGLMVTPISGGARLHCAFQQLDGDATREGLWLISTLPGQANDRFRITAMTVGRAANIQLPRAGDVSTDGTTVRFCRPGLTEEYSVSVNGVQQDFVVADKPAGAGQLKVQLTLDGASAEAAPDGARLVLSQSGRKIAYNRLRATDAVGRDLSAKIEVLSPGQLSVVVDDVAAQYPVRIDPTFSAANWVSLGGIPGTSGSLDAVAVDGSGNVYIGGNFTVAGNILATNIAEWTGSSWLPLSSGMNGSVDALVFSGNTLYAGGAFTNAGGVMASNIAGWNGTSWSALGVGMNNSVFALAVSNSILFAGGSFTSAGGAAASFIAQWNGTAWSPMGSGMNAQVLALAVVGTNLYAGGGFTGAGGIPASFIARWNGIQWFALGLGASGGVSALASSGTNLYVGGSFIRVTNFPTATVPANDIALWNGSSWSAMGVGFNNDVRGLATLGTNVYAVGDFTIATNTGGGTVTPHYVAQWNGTSWSALGVGAGNGGFAQTFAVAAFGTNVYLGGFFSAVSPAAGVIVPADNVAQWTGSTWLPMGSGLASSVGAVAILGNTLYIGGAFRSVPGGVNFLAQWTGSNWAALGSGVNNSVGALATYGTNLIVGGFFNAAGGLNATNVAAWNGTGWSTLGLGMAGSFGPGSSTVNALIVSGTNLIAGGMFVGAGGVAATNVAEWNGSSWLPLGMGVGNSGSLINALALSGTNLIVGGNFSIAGGVTAYDIAQWNGSAWSALGVGMGGSVNALAVLGTNVYAAGSFTRVTNSGNVAVAAYRVAQWNGSSWSPVGVGLNNTVNALAVSDSYLYAGGSFTIATNTGNVTVTAADFAQWDGTNWTAVGLGMNGAVSALAVSGNTLLAGGNFTAANGVVSGYAAEAFVLPATPLLSITLSGGNAIVTWPTNYTGYTLLYSSDLMTPHPWPPFPTGPTAINGLWTVPAPISAAPREFFELAH
jgi:hypothetical protein